MRLCLAGTFPAEKIVKEYRPEYVLESFFYIRPWQIEEIPKWKMFLLDSGAFTFMHGIEASSKPVDWDGYLSRYMDYAGQFRRAVVLQWFGDGRGQTAQGDDRG